MQSTCSSLFFFHFSFLLFTNFGSPLVVVRFCSFFFLAMPNETPVSRSTRGRKGSVKDCRDTPEATATSINSFSDMLLASEQRLKSFFKDEMRAIYDKLHSFEVVVSNLQSECIRLDTAMMSMKKVIVEQQKVIEQHEENARVNNLIIHNVPEFKISGRGPSAGTLESDTDKVVFVCNEAEVDIDDDDIAAVHRLGKKSSGRPRPLKVIMKERESKFQLLNKRREVAQSKSIASCFGNKVFINPDSSFLSQKEHFRLRQEAKRLRSEYPDDNIFLRSGSLYRNGSVVDKITVEKQLF